MRQILISLFLLVYVTCYAQERDETIYINDTILKKKNVQIIGLPVVFYTPETEFGFGGGTQFFFKNILDIINLRESNLLITAIYTSKKQLVIEAKPQFYLIKGNVYIDAALKYKVFPNSFWGIGNSMPDSLEEKYNMKTFYTHLAFLKRVSNTTRFGLEYIYEKHTMLEVVEGGMLASDSIRGGGEGSVTIINGFGLIFRHDSRDNVFSPNSGNYLQFKGRYSSKLLGASYGYNKFEIDFRKYFQLGGNNVLAMQVFVMNAMGDVPFQDMAWFGGGIRGRGYYYGRYIDKQMYSFQLEYRIRLHPRWSVAAFVSGGEVAPNIKQYFSNFHASAGGGVRFKPLKKNPTILRLDYGKGPGNNSGIYFGINEAF